MKASGRKEPALGTALLIYITAVMFLITLIPFQFRIPGEFQIYWPINLMDNITNLFLFIPIGFLFRLNGRKGKDPLLLKAFAYGTLLGMAIESTQVFIPGRYPQVIDIITNGLGAWIGALLFKILEGHLKEEHTVRLFAMELPLMNLVYLLIPLLWLNGLSMGEEPSRIWLMLLPGLFGGGVLAAVYNHRLKQRGKLTPHGLSLFSMGWFILASIPALLNFPVQIIIIDIMVGVFVQLPVRFAGKNKDTEKRFELPTLKKLLPLYVIYLILLAAWPTTVSLNEWQFYTHFQELGLDERIVFTFRFIELIAAFTLLGYMAAEMRGRKTEPTRKTFVWVILMTLSISVIIVISRGLPPLSAHHILEIGIVTAASLYGAVIYKLQLSAIQRIAHSPTTNPGKGL